LSFLLPYKSTHFLGSWLEQAEAKGSGRSATFDDCAEQRLATCAGEKRKKLLVGLEGLYLEWLQ